MSLSAEQEADCLEAFTLFDRSGSNKLKVAELGGVLRALGHNLAGDELTKALEPLGGKKDVAFADFKKVMEGLTDTTPTKDIVNAFKVFDKDVRSTAHDCRSSCLPVPQIMRTVIRLHAVLLWCSQPVFQCVASLVICCRVSERWELQP